MNSATLEQLKALEAQLEALTEALANAAAQPFDIEQHSTLSAEFARLQSIDQDYQLWKKLQAEHQAIEELCEGADASLLAWFEEERHRVEEDLKALDLKIEASLLPKELEEEASCYLEIRAGTGGEEASLFAAELYRMYHQYAVQQGWSLELQDRSETESGGIREVCLKIRGYGAYGKFRHESGGHRVQRVPATESQGRIHTSACSVLVMPEMPKQTCPELKPSELRIDTFRASGAGGQHVNKTDSAVRITHLPTGLVATCQNGRSQHQNRESAMEQLLARLIAQERAKAHAAEQAVRASLLSGGGRTDRIRTYNFPQNRVTDHRIGLTLYQLESILAGGLDPILEKLLQTHQRERLEVYRLQKDPLKRLKTVS